MSPPITDNDPTPNPDEPTTLRALYQRLLEVEREQRKLRSEMSHATSTMAADMKGLEEQIEHMTAQFNELHAVITSANHTTSLWQQGFDRKLDLLLGQKP